MFRTLTTDCCHPVGIPSSGAFFHGIFGFYNTCRYEMTQKLLADDSGKL